jgi:hypothetical protein
VKAGGTDPYTGPQAALLGNLREVADEPKQNLGLSAMVAKSPQRLAFRLGSGRGMRPGERRGPEEGEGVLFRKVVGLEQVRTQGRGRSKTVEVSPTE